MLDLEQRLEAVETAFEKNLAAKQAATDAKFEADMAAEALIEVLVEAGMYHCLAVKPGVIRAHLRSEKNLRKE